MSNGKEREEDTGLLGGTSGVPLGDTEPAEQVNGVRFFITKRRGDEKRRVNRFFDALGYAAFGGRVDPLVPYTKVYTPSRICIAFGMAIASFAFGTALASFKIESLVHSPGGLHSAISDLNAKMEEQLGKATVPRLKDTAGAFEKTERSDWSVVPTGCSITNKASAQGICAVQLQYASPNPPNELVNARVLCRSKHNRAQDDKPFYSDIGNLRLGDIMVDPNRPKLGYGRPLSNAHRKSHYTEAKFCHIHCQNHKDCKMWTVWGGNCWLKSCKVGEPGCPVYWDNDIGGHKMTNTSKHFAVWGVKGCNFITSVLDRGHCNVVLADSSRIQKDIQNGLPWCEDWFQGSCHDLQPGLSTVAGNMCMMKTDQPEEKVRFQALSMTPEPATNIQTEQNEEIDLDVWSLVPSGCSVTDSMSARGICAVSLQYNSPEPPHPAVDARVLCRNRNPSDRDDEPFYSDVGNLRMGDILTPSGYGRPLSEEHKVNHYTEAKFCHIHCQRNEACKMWTVWGGNCYMKSCAVGEPGCPVYWDNDIGGHKMTNASKHFAVWGIKGCNFITSVLHHGRCKVILNDPRKVQQELDHLPWCEDWFGAPCREVEKGLSPTDLCLARKDRPVEKVRFTTVSRLFPKHPSVANAVNAMLEGSTGQFSAPSHTVALWRGLTVSIVGWFFLALGIMLDLRLDCKAARQRHVGDLGSSNGSSNLGSSARNLGFSLRQ